LMGQFNTFNQFGLVYHYVISIFLFQGTVNIFVLCKNIITDKSLNNKH